MAKPKTPKSAATEDTADQIEDQVAATQAESDRQDPAPDMADPVAAAEPARKEPAEVAKAPDSKAKPKDPKPADVPKRPEPAVSKAPAAAPARRKGGFVPMVLGGIVAAGIGAGATIYLLPKLPPEWLPVSQTPQVDEAALREAIDTQGARLEALGNELTALRGAAPAASDLQAALAELHQTSEGLAAVQTRLATLESRPAEGGGAPSAALEALQRDMEQMRATLEQSRNAGDTTQEQIAAAAEQAAARIAEAEQEAAQLRQEADAAARRAMAQAAVARLAAAVESGIPAAPALGDLQAAGVTIPAELQGDIPSLASLRSSFPEAARAALAAARKATAGEGTMDRIGAFLLAQTGARSLEPREGADPDAILSRAEAALEGGNLETVLTEIATLPEAGKAALSDWVALAEQRLAATNALGALAQSLN